MIKISIIVPVYNTQKYITECVESILNQTYSRFELILVDDGSTDNSGNLCDALAKTDDRVKVVHKNNGGVSSARNAGLEIATGDYIGWVDSDDYVEPDMFEFLLTNALNYNADISECNYASVYKNKTQKATFGNEKLTYGDGDFMVERYVESDIFYGIVTKLFKRKVFDNVTFPPGRIWEDIWLVAKVSFGNYSYVRDPQIKYYYRQTEGSIIRSPISERKARESIYILENTLSLIEHNIQNKILKQKLVDLNMQKAVLWYLDLALSENKRIRKVYSNVYLSRMQFSLFNCLFSNKLSIKNKISFTCCRIGLKNQLYFVKQKIATL